MEVIEIKGVIDQWGFMTDHVTYYLDKYKGQPVTVKVSSYGGSVSEALNISRAFAEHGNVTVQLLGFCASAVTWMAYGAKRVEMADDGFWLCHRSTINVDIWKNLNAEELARTIKELESQKKSQEAIDLMIAKKYIDHAAANKKKLSTDQILSLMNEQRWMPAEEALETGFVDAILKNSKSVSEDNFNFLVENASSLNLPLPVRMAERKETILDKMKKIFTRKDATMEEVHQDSAIQEESETINISTTKKNVTMHENFIKVNDLLGVQALQEEDGKVALTTDQIQAIETALEEAESTRQQLQDAVEALDSFSDSVKNIDGAKNKALAITTLASKMPIAAPAGAGVVPTTDQAEEQIKKIRQHAIDPINQEALNF